MSLKIVAEDLLRVPAGGSVVVREYDESKDRVAVEELERKCEFGQRGKPSLVTDLLGDPLGRVRHFPLHVMLVVEYSDENGEIVGVIRACIKIVTKEHSNYVKLACILGLRVSPTHRRLGIGTRLVQEIEKWCKKNGAEYAYMATDCSNQPSINLFTRKCSYTKFRTPTMLVQPVYAHYKQLNSDISIIRLDKELAEIIYRQIFANAEFFPRDIGTILSSKLNLGTFMAVPKKFHHKWDIKKGILPSSYAIMSVWNTKEVFKLQVKGVSKLKHACCIGSRMLDSWMSCLKLPSFPDVFRKFGVYFLYGLHMEGKYQRKLMKALCGFAHDMGRDDGGCGAIVAEVGQTDPVRQVIPHWKKLSLSEDLWCIKQLASFQKTDEKYKPTDWKTSPPSSSVIFVDPRDI